jgi:ferredoxin
LSKIETVQSLYFSPGGTTKKITKAIEKNIGLKRTTAIDLTRPSKRKRFKGEVKGDLLIVGMPVYHESPPWPTLEPLNKLKGEGKWAIPVAVYGNRTEGTCVEEMGKILKSRGFKIPAASAFVAEHSWASKERPYALGRPNRTDMRIAADFGKRIGSKLSLAPPERMEIHLSSRLVDYFTHQEVESFPGDYHRRCVESLTGLGGVAYDEAACTNCMNCVGVCPTSAIQMQPFNLELKECVRCMACVKACPTGALKLKLVDTPQNRERFNILDRVFAIRREPITRL